jgi:hypothetical protein
VAAFDVLSERAQTALNDPGMRLAVRGAMWTVAMEIIQETAGHVGTNPDLPVDLETAKRRSLANRVMDDPKSERLTDQFALALAADTSIGNNTTAAQFLAAVRAKWNTVARVHPEDTETPATA